MIQRLEKSNRYFRVKRGAGAGENGAGDFAFCFVVEIRIGIDVAVVVTGQRQNPGTEGDVYRFEMLRIAAAVPTFVMEADIGDEILAGRIGFEHVGAKIRVFFVELQFPGGEVGKFIKNPVGHGKKTDVVEKPCIMDERHLIGRKPHMERGGTRKIGHPHGVFIKSLGFQAHEIRKMKGQFLQRISHAAKRSR